MGLQVPHRYDGRTMMVDSEMLELDRQAKLGDPVSGWRGDPQMWVALLPSQVGPDVVEVWGLDAYNREYLAASTPATDGWRHRLLEKLVKGDWQQRAGDLIEQTMASNAKIRADAEARHADYIREEFAPKLRWALQKDGVAPRDTFYFSSKEG